MQRTASFQLSAMLCLMVSAALIGGCTSQEIEETPEVEDTALISIESILQQPRLLAIADNTKLLLIDPASAKYSFAYDIPAEQMPPVLEYSSFRISQDKQHIVWYAPQTGIMEITLPEIEVTRLYEPTSWFNSNPYFVLNDELDDVIFVDEEGLRLVTIDLISHQISKQPIPFPFGTVFHVSPNGNAIVFISGYKQNQDAPQYMFTDNKAENPIRFEANNEIADRHMISWLPDSSGIIVIENAHQLVTYPIANPEDPKLFYEVADDERIVEVQLLDDHVYFYTTAEAWYVLDGKANLVARVPSAIAIELNKPVFHPWAEKEFIIEEVFFPEPDYSFKRLWFSNHMGIKKIILPSFQEKRIETNTPVLD